MYYFIFDFVCYHVRLNMKKEPLAYFITNIITTLFANKNYFVTQNSNLRQSSVVPNQANFHQSSFEPNETNLRQSSFDVLPKQGQWVV